MSASLGNLLPPARTRGASTRNPVARCLRELVRRRLSELKSGTLQVSDPWGEWQVGDGTGVTVRIKVESAGFYRDIALGGSLGAARAWMDGRWDCDDLTSVFALLVRNTRLMDQMEGGLSFLGNALDTIRHRLRPNSRSGSRRNIHAHYDLGNDFFATFLDDTMTYSCGIFASESFTLREASVEKLDRICRKLNLSPRTVSSKLAAAGAASPSTPQLTLVATSRPRPSPRSNSTKRVDALRNTG